MGFTTLVYSLEAIPLFIVVIIYNTAPFWTGIMGHYFLSDQFTKLEVFLIMGCFSGVIVLALAKGNVIGAAESINEVNS